MPRSGEHHTPETRAKIAAAQWERWDDPALLARQADRTRMKWQDPEYREHMRKRRLEAKAQALGTTVERLEAEPIPAAGRHAVLKALFWQGLDLSAVVALHPRVPFNAVQKAKFAVIVEWFNKTGLFGGPWDHPEIVELLQGEKPCS